MDLKDIIKAKFPFFYDKNLINEIATTGKYQELDEGDILLDVGQTIKSIPLLISGAIKVLREDEEGDELLMFYLQGGESCAMSFVCCMMKEQSKIRAVVDEAAEAILIPLDFMEKWMSDYPDWRNFVLNSYSNRFENLLNTIDNIAFKKLDERLKEYLDTKFDIKQTDVLNIKHKDIAYEMNTSREVISRMLKKLEKMNYYKLGRNTIEKIKLS